MNKSKKIISLLFVVLLLVSIVPMSVSAAEIAYGDFSFKTDSLTREATLVDYNGDADSVNIPDTVYGYTVTRIDDLVFFKHDEIQSVSLPNTIKSIGFSAFSDCAKLKKIILPVTVTSMGEYVFQNCTSLQEAYVNSAIVTLPASTFSNCTSLSKVNINFYTKKIGNRVFDGCTSLKTLPEAVGITEIGDEAFRNTGLDVIKIDYPVTKIGYGAFSDCENLSYIGIPNSVTSIGNDAFSNCAKDLTIRGDYGSYAEKYATENNINFEENPLIIGDVNDDGEINVKDATYVQRFTVLQSGYEIPDGSPIFKRADVNGDGKVNVVDATLIQKYAMHMIDEF